MKRQRWVEKRSAPATEIEWVLNGEVGVVIGALEMYWELWEERFAEGQYDK